MDFTPSFEALFLDPSSVPLPEADDEDMADDTDESPQAVTASVDPAAEEEEAPERERKRTRVSTPEREEHKKGEAQACEGAQNRENAYMHRDLAETISSLSATKSGPASQIEGLTARIRASAEDLSVMIKHCNTDVIGRLKGRTATLAVADPPVDRVLAFQHLRSGDMKLSVRKEDVVFLCHHPQWTRL